MGDYGQVLAELRASFASGKTKTYEWRVGQLKQVIRFFQENEEQLAEALYKDLRKSHLESEIMETLMCINDAVDAIRKLKEWMKPTKVSKDAINLMDKAYIFKEPLGVTLIIGTWNFPILLLLNPLIGAISAGNCVVLKPSEVAGATAKFIEDYLPKYLDGDCFRVINGGVSETTALLKERFDLIFYTGSTTVGKIVMKAAAENLTPVILELGGKSPVYVDKDADLGTVARRLCWGKFCNAGQICIAPDYVMCQPELQNELITKIKSVIEEYYTVDPKKSDSYCRIVNERHYQRVQNMKEGSVVAIGGEEDETENYIAPTVLRDVKISDKVMQDEIYGPLLPIVPVKNYQEAIEIINSREKPLSLYVFTNNKKVAQDFINQTSSGGVLINDTIVHAGLSTLPFGGVGHSGMGSYHGKFSFNAFSHSKAILEKSLGMERFNSLRYPPYTAKKQAWLKWIVKKKLKL